MLVDVSPPWLVREEVVSAASSSSALFQPWESFWYVFDILLWQFYAWKSSAALQHFWLVIIGFNGGRNMYVEVDAPVEK